MRWYLGGIAGDDVEAGKRIARDQLDGVGAGAWQCQRWAPSMKVTRLPGLFRNPRSRSTSPPACAPCSRRSSKKPGFVYLGDARSGASTVFLRRRSSFDELKHTRLWDARHDPPKSAAARRHRPDGGAAARSAVRGSLRYKRVDGFLAPPTGALAFQWSTQARYVLEVPTDYILGCLVVSTRAFDRLPFAHQQAVRAAAAKFAVRFDEVAARMDRELLGGLFARQGLKTVREPTLRADTGEWVVGDVLTVFKQAAEVADDRVAGHLTRLFDGSAISHDAGKGRHNDLMATFG